VSRVAISKIVSARMRSETDRWKALLPSSENNKWFRRERIQNGESEQI
jgi:hypothetical protein